MIKNTLCGNYSHSKIQNLLRTPKRSDCKFVVWRVVAQQPVQEPHRFYAKPKIYTFVNNICGYIEALLDLYFVSSLHGNWIVQEAILHCLHKQHHDTFHLSSWSIMGCFQQIPNIERCGSLPEAGPQSLAHLLQKEFN